MSVLTLGGAAYSARMIVSFVLQQNDGFEPDLRNAALRAKVSFHDCLDLIALIETLSQGHRNAERLNRNL